VITSKMIAHCPTEISIFCTIAQGFVLLMILHYLHRVLCETFKLQTVQVPFQQRNRSAVFCCHHFSYEFKGFLVVRRQRFRAVKAENDGQEITAEIGFVSNLWYTNHHMHTSNKIPDAGQSNYH